MKRMAKFKSNFESCRIKRYFTKEKKEKEKKREKRAKPFILFQNLLK